MKKNVKLLENARDDLIKELSQYHLYFLNEVTEEPLFSDLFEITLSMDNDAFNYVPFKLDNGELTLLNVDDNSNYYLPLIDMELDDLLKVSQFLIDNKLYFNINTIYSSSEIDTLADVFNLNYVPLSNVSYPNNLVGYDLISLIDDKLNHNYLFILDSANAVDYFYKLIFKF